MSVKLEKNFIIFFLDFTFVEIDHEESHFVMKHLTPFPRGRTVLYVFRIYLIQFLEKFPESEIEPKLSMVNNEHPAR